MSREAIIGLLDNVDESEYELLYRVILKFVREVPALPDEVEAIKTGELEYARGEVYSHDEVWG